MSYGLSVFLVSRDAVRYVPGCRDLALLADILEQEHFGISDYDQQIFDEGETEHFTYGDALREIIEGSYSHPEVYHVYGWSFEILCDYLGKRLSNDPFSPCSTGWLRKLDGYLAGESVRLRFDDLIEKCPVPLPLPTDWPRVGHWTGPQMHEAARGLIDLLPRVRDRDVQTALTTVNSWLYRAILSPETIIVGFYG
jgi:hypothetical protein